jgi:hypothetical protein
MTPAGTMETADRSGNDGATLAPTLYGAPIT